MQKLKPTSVLWEKFPPPPPLLYRRRTYEYKNKQKITYWTNKCKNCVMKEICCKKKRITEQFKTIATLPRLECNGKWKQNGHKKSTKNDQKQQNYHLHT